ncbi:hypothetical protein [Streptomyces lunalinharesii]
MNGGIGAGNATGPAASASPKGGSDAAAPVTQGPDAAGDDTGKTNEGASLAETDSDAASCWMLGVGGASTALGTALAVAARKRRGKTS